MFKHAVLTLILELLLRKPNPFAVLDTHAGLGVYDLDSAEAMRTNERSEGADRVFGNRLGAAPTYSAVMEALNDKSLRFYPGSPELVRCMLRRHDRLIACELHPEDGTSLKRTYRKDARIEVHERDGYEAVAALLPPKERRGLVFIDPPFEQRSETDQIANALKTGFRKWESGIFAIWYPIKDSAIGERIGTGAMRAGFTNILRSEFYPFRRDGISLAGSGLVICNPPWTLDEKIRLLCQELSGRLGSGDSSWAVGPITSVRSQ